MNFLKNSVLFQEPGLVPVLIITTLISIYYFPGQEGWLLLSAVMACLISRGAPLTQAMGFFLWILIVMVVDAYIPESWELPILIVTILTAGVITHLHQPLNEQQQRIYFLVPLIVIIALLIMPQSQQLSISFTAVTVGTVIGLLFGQLPYYIALENQFRSGVKPLLIALNRYSHALTQQFVEPSPLAVNPIDHFAILLPARLEVEKALQARPGGYPEWVYDIGFKPGLRSGMRYFLLTLERVAELLFARDYYLSQPVEPQWRETLKQPLRLVTANNGLLLQAILDWFDKTPEKTTNLPDLTQDIQMLEAACQTLIPAPLELLDYKEQYLVLTVIVRDYKAIRTLLLQLHASLPASN